MKSRFALPTLVLCGLGIGCSPKPAETAGDDAPASGEGRTGAPADGAPGHEAGDPGRAGVPSEPGDARLALGPVTLSTDDDPSRTIELDAEGTVQLGGRPVGVIDPVAATLGTKSGTVVATLGDDGKIEASRGLPVRVVDDGVEVTLPNARVYAVRFEADGDVTMKPADGTQPAPDEKTPPPITASGCEGEMLQTCAFLFGTMTFVVGTKKAAG